MPIANRIRHSNTQSKILLFVFLICTLIKTSAQEIALEPSFGIGNNIDRKNSQGRIHLGLKSFYKINRNIDVGVEGIVGGNFISGGLGGSKGEDELVINSESLNFSFFGVAGRYNFRKELKDSYFFSHLSFGSFRHSAKNIGLENNESIRQNSLGGTVELGYNLNDFSFGIKYIDAGKISGFTKTSDRDLPAIMEPYRSQMFFLNVSYQFKLF